jgi:hypothetical protein
MFDSFDEWLRFGYNKGWCGPDVCETHDGLPTTDLEDIAFDEGEDPCIHIIRLYEDLNVKAAVEENHSPSKWRASNQGL